MPKRKPPPAFIRSEADLAAHLDALSASAPSFAPLRVIAGEVPLRWLDSGFAGLVWVITGQQISVAAGRAIYNRCQAALGAITAEAILAADDATLRAAGFSAPKIRTLRAISEAAAAGALDLDGLGRFSAEEAIVHMTAIKGVGPWTAEVYLLFALGHPDIFPAKDVALQEAARLAFDLPARPTDKQLAAMAEEWRPYRSAAARLLWSYYRAAKSRDAAPVQSPV
ncbi:MAG: DNA-3-methyladenine glycosylase 2 family protein [Hyphomicrobiales bacterium]|nr:DNA-3-methyladenine glycosylase 2 family protein [Hyphomicrobiales bacterium]